MQRQQHTSVYWVNLSIEDTIATALHVGLSHLEQQQRYAGMLFTGRPSKLSSRISWSTNWTPWVSTVSHAPGSRTFWPTDPRLAPTFPPPAHEALAHHKAVCWTPSCTVSIPTTAISPTTVAFVDWAAKTDEQTGKEDVQTLKIWCSDNNVALNTTKTKEITVDNMKAAQTILAALCPLWQTSTLPAASASTEDH